MSDQDQVLALQERVAGLLVLNRELTRERDEARAQVAKLDQECQVEIAFKRVARETGEKWQKRFEQLADEALVALAGHVATPERTYKEEPQCLSGDIGRLVAKWHEAQLEARKWKGHWEMYSAAWFRELGGRVFAKTHEIDALVLTTRWLRDKVRDQEWDGKLGPRIVCLCGSTRFWKQFQEASLKETLEGKIVLSIGAATGSDDEHFGHMPSAEYDRVKQQLDALHLRKIDLCHEVLVLNVGGYIGHSTRNELDYAREHGKAIRFLEEETPRVHLGEKPGRNPNADVVAAFPKGRWTP